MSGKQQPEARPKSAQFQLRQVTGLMRRNRALILGIPLAVLMLTALFLVAMRPVYEAASSIRIESERSGVQLVQVLAALGSQSSPVHTEMEILKSRTVAEDVVDSLSLTVALEEPARELRSSVLANIAATREAIPAEYTFERTGNGAYEVEIRFRPPGQDGILAVLRPARVEKIGPAAIGQPVQLRGVNVTLAPGAASHEKIVVAVRDYPTTLRDVRRDIAVSKPNREADLVVAAYTGHDPEIVRDVPNVLTASYLARRQGDATAEANTTVRYLSNELDSVTAQIGSIESELRTFMEGASVVNLEAEGTAQVRRLAEMQAQRDLLEAERSSLIKLIRDTDGTATDADPALYRRMFAFPTLLKNPAVGTLLTSLSELQNERAGLLGKSTPNDPTVIAITERIEEMESELRSIAATYLQGLTNQVAAANAALAASAGELSGIPAKEIRYARLTREGEVLGEIYGLLQTRLKEAEIAASLEDMSVNVVDPAILPDRPVSPNKPLSLAFALVFGLVLGGAAAFAREQLDPSVHTGEELQDVAALPVLGVIPRMREPVASENGRGRAAGASPAAMRGLLLSNFDGDGAIADGYYALRSNLAFSPGAAPKVILVTSPLNGDGKTVTAANLAASLAQKGGRVLVVDADLRAGRLADVFGVPSAPGLAELLAGDADPASATRRVSQSGGDSFELLPAGRHSASSTELLSGAGSLIERLRGQYDYVVIDSPAVNVARDAQLISTASDLVLLVVRAGVTDRESVLYAREQLADSAAVIGSVLNDVDLRRQPRYAVRPHRLQAIQGVHA